MSEYAAMELLRQHNRGPNPEEGFYRLKVTGNGETKWVNISPDELAQIVTVLDPSLTIA